MASEQNNDRVTNNKRVRFVAYILFGVLFLLTLEFGCRVFLMTKYPDVSFLNHSELIYKYYSNVRHVEKADPKKGDGVFDILLLGGSVLHPNNGEIAEKLKLQLKELDSKYTFKIHNVAYSGHTSRDSKIRMELLSNYHFDLVIFYHGINEVRANNCPPSVFKKDYSHFVWYDEINRLKKYSGNEFSSIPLAFNYFEITLAEKILSDRYIPEGHPVDGWREYGGNIKTRNSFQSNIISIKDMVNSMGSKLIVPTFTYHLESGYTLKKFEERRYRDDRDRFPVEIWGYPKNVVKGIEAHNGIIKKMSGVDGLIVTDLDSMMKKNDEFFDDICHLTERGSERFAQIITHEITKIIKD